MYGIYEKRPDAISFNQSSHLAAYPKMLHRDAEFVYVMDGEFTTQIDKTQVTLEKGDISITFPHVIHSSLKSDATLRILMFDPTRYGAFGNVFLKKRPIVPYLRASELPECIPTLFEYIRRVKGSAGEFSMLTLEAYVSACMGELFECVKFCDVEPNSLNALERIVLYCSENYACDISLESVSAAVNISRTQLTRIFSSRFECNFRSYINEMRVHGACELLAHTDKSVTEILYECGFCNQSTFNRAFHGITGMTPREYRDSL